MILRLRPPFGFLNSEKLKVLSQSRKRASVKRSCQIMRRIRQEQTSPETDKQIKIFPCRVLFSRLRCSFTKCGMHDSDRAQITAQKRQT